MSFGQVEGFFVDSCVLLPQPIESLGASCADFLKESSKRCILCSSVKKEAFKLIEDSYSIIVSTFRSKLKPFLERHGIKELTNKYGTLLAQFFSEQKRYLRHAYPQRSRVRNELIGTMETYVASRLHSLKDGLKVPIDDFLAAMITELTMKKHDLQVPFLGLRCVNIVPDDPIFSLIVLSTPIRNTNDVRHLASALKYQFQRNKWVIFVTTDERDILSNQKEIFEIFALQCSKPEWASDYYRDMTRMKSPVEYFREIQNYSEKQKEFGNKIEKIMGTKILG